MLIIVFLSMAAVKFKVDDFFIHCVEKLGEMWWRRCSKSSMAA